MSKAIDEGVKLVVAGGRDFTDWQRAFRVIEKFNKEIPVIEIVSGGAKGADKIGEKYAALRGLPVKRFLPDWNAYGKSAGPIRNRDMADYADALIAFWDGKSRGTGSMIRLAVSAGLTVKVQSYD